MAVFYNDKLCPRVLQKGIHQFSMSNGHPNFSCEDGSYQLWRPLRDPNTKLFDLVQRPKITIVEHQPPTGPVNSKGGLGIFPTKSAGWRASLARVQSERPADAPQKSSNPGQFDPVAHTHDQVLGPAFEESGAGEKLDGRPDESPGEASYEGVAMDLDEDYEEDPDEDTDEDFGLTLGSPVEKNVRDLTDSSKGGRAPARVPTRAAARGSLRVTLRVPTRALAAAPRKRERDIWSISSSSEDEQVDASEDAYNPSEDPEEDYDDDDAASDEDSVEEADNYDDEAEKYDDDEIFASSSRRVTKADSRKRKAPPTIVSKPSKKLKVTKTQTATQKAPKEKAAPKQAAPKKAVTKKDTTTKTTTKKTAAQAATPKVHQAKARESRVAKRNAKKNRRYPSRH
ncbi:hypothetical protein F5Y04DRAFT_274909 [Hypomontagnella monticulosa]|nr:hypothetical protein F5Y04DRAFT_274909 [Hypomontagnella monticulosa]